MHGSMFGTEILPMRALIKIFVLPFFIINPKRMFQHFKLDLAMYVTDFNILLNYIMFSVKG